MAKEPLQLRLGREFHRSVQRDFVRTSDVLPLPEHCTVDLSGRPGRIDIFCPYPLDPTTLTKDRLEVAAGKPPWGAALYELKGTDWDRIMPTRIRPNVRRQARQLWRYVYAEAYGSFADRSYVAIEIGLIFPRRPLAAGLAERVEELFEDDDIPVYWYDQLMAPLVSQ